MENKRERKKIIIMSVVVAALFIIAVVLLILCFTVQKDEKSVQAVNSVTEASLSSENASTEPKPTEAAATEATPTEPKSTEAAESIAESSEESSAQEQSGSDSQTSAPEAMIQALAIAGYGVNDLSAGQLIVVNSSGSNAVVSMYEKQSDGKWLDCNLTSFGFVGSNGVDTKSVEGDRKTPFGLFPIGDMFYIDSPPSTGLGSFPVTEDTYWVDDPSSAYYNMRVEGTANMDWNSAEHMIDYYSSYKYGFVIDYNTNPIVPGKGSAIFFHVGYAPTAGCVAVSEGDVLSYLAALDGSRSPYILIV